MTSYITIESQIRNGDKSVTPKDLADSFFAEKYAELVREGEEIRAKAEADRIAQADTTFAEFVADVLKANARNLNLPYETTVGVGVAKKGDIPSISVKPLEATEHTGYGLASGKVSLTLTALSAFDVNTIRDLFAQHALHGNRAAVKVGNWPSFTIAMTNAILPTPVIAQPSAEGLAAEFARRARALNQHPTHRDPVEFVATSGHDSIVGSGKASFTVRGHVAVTATESYPGYAANDLTNRLRSVIEGKKGFAIGLGVVQKCSIVDVKPTGLGVRITFEAEVSGRASAAA